MGFTAWVLIGMAALAVAIFVTSKMKKRRTVNTRAPEGEEDDYSDDGRPKRRADEG